MITYSLHVAILIVMSLCFYKLMLKRETYHKLNRVVLLACLTLAFVMPLVPVPQGFSLIRENAVELSVFQPDNYQETSIQQVSKHLPQQQAVASQTVESSKPNSADSFTKQNMLRWGLVIYWCGVAIFGINLLIQLMVVLYKISKSQVIEDGIYRIVELDDDKAPCSFGNYIFINPTKYDWDTYEQILIHEKVHVQQLHTLDLMLAEVMTVFQWFNPLAWLYRKEIENNLEFLTDHTVVDTYHVKQDDYQLNLLKVCVPNYSMRITTNYNQSLLKQRIMMMNSKRSNIHIVWKYFVIVPLFALMVCLLNKPVAVSAQVAQKIPIDTLKKKSKVVVTDVRLASTQKVKLVKKPATLVTNNKLAAKNGRTYVVTKNGGVTDVVVDKPISQGHGLTTLNGVSDRAVSVRNGLTFTQSDVGRTGAQTISSAGFRNFTADDLIDLQANGVNPLYIKGIAESGFKNFTAKDIIDLQANGVTALYLKGVSQAGFNHFTSKDIIDLQANGVTTLYLKSVSAAGYSRFTSKDIIKLHENGVSMGVTNK